MFPSSFVRDGITAAITLLACLVLSSTGLAQMAFDGSIISVDADDPNAPPGMFNPNDVVSPEADATASVAAGNGTQGFFLLRVVCRDVNGNILASASTLQEINPGNSSQLNVRIDSFTCPSLTEYYVDAVLSVHDPAIGGDPPPFEIVAFDSVMYVLSM